ncbi:hypothetical protein DFR29_103262 [Tahibacter aquaticus]|uniref:YprB ribonuclease H-like domain-containing protein n=1 Tax=Tahibacter aquaticus TaxID=520092 RepID=A0A4V3DN16_9GAMM|nr:ribonuclease H-like domain-containing protein [Tahibacter aquaticus]TDR46726.1 hypothetical protein DFR29_103262 [Tahibacter aquaticus]
MSALQEKLRRLQRQAGAAGVKPASAEMAAPMTGEPATDAAAQPAAAPLQSHNAARPGVQAELDRLRRLLDLRPASALPRQRDVLPLRGEAIAPGLYYVEHSVDDPGRNALLPPRWPEAEAVARERFLCFDTETTGLAGGSGTRAFMIGAADWYRGRLRVRQLYLTAMGGESAMLQHFVHWLAPDTVLVSYNGRSYDAPLLATRYRLARLANPLAGKSHVDLLHPVRRVYRGRWENCRLATIERQVLKIVREDDLPGSQAPAAWRAYLREGASTDLMRVLEHNRQDVVTLARLLEHMDQAATPSAWLGS